MLDKYRVKCSNCGVKVEKLDFGDLYSRHITRFEEYVARLCRITSLKQVADLLELDWKTVKNIDKKYLEKEFAIPNYNELRILAVDEISSKKGHHYFSIKQMMCLDNHTNSLILTFNRDLAAMNHQ